MSSVSEMSFQELKTLYGVRLSRGENGKYVFLIPAEIDREKSINKQSEAVQLATEMGLVVTGYANLADGRFVVAELPLLSLWQSVKSDPEKIEFLFNLICLLMDAET
jgi:hypothetical protein